MNRAWIERELGGRVVATRRLYGGIVSRVDEVRVERRSGVRVSAVVRRYEDAADAIAYEARILTALESVRLPAPRLLGVHGSALLMTKLPGRVHLEPRDLRVRLRRMIEPLPILHASAALREVGVHLKMNPRSYDWVRDPGLRRAAEELVARLPSRIARVPTHGDYQHFNMLWSRERLTGIVDWSGIWNGPPEVDVCHCRLNLAVLYGPDVADEFRDIYEAEAGRRVDPWHDVHRLGVYSDDWPRFIPLQVHGRTKVKPGMTERVEELLRRALSRA